MAKNKTAELVGKIVGKTASLLTFVFLVLHLFEVIDWSPLWVLSPLWLAIGFSLVLFMIAGILGAIDSAIREREHRKKKEELMRYLGGS